MEDMIERSLVSEERYGYIADVKSGRTITLCWRRNFSTGYVEVGTALCNKRDRFNKAKGRMIALGRLNNPESCITFRYKRLERVEGYYVCMRDTCAIALLNTYFHCNAIKPILANAIESYILSKRLEEFIVYADGKPVYELEES